LNPKERIESYLRGKGLNIESYTLDQAVRDVKLGVFYGMPPISDDEIRTIIARWAMFNAPGLIVKQPAAGAPPPNSGAASPTSSSELIDSFKRAVTLINNGVTFGKSDGTNLNIGVTGLTANLKGGGDASLALSWGGTLQFNAASGPIHFSASLSKDKWEMSLSLPDDSYVPDLSKLESVVRAGQDGVIEMAKATRSFHNISDASKVGALMKPHVKDVQDAVEALSGIAKAPKTGMSFGFKIGSPDPLPGQEGMQPGVQGEVVLTWVF
jgi:hypothetical protein